MRRDAGLPELFDGVTYAYLGVIELESDRPVDALAHFRRILAPAAARGIAQPLGFPLLGCAVALHRCGDDARAALLFGFVEANHHHAEIRVVPQAAAYRAELAEALADSGGVREGRLLALEDVLDPALADTRQLSR